MGNQFGTHQHSTPHENALEFADLIDASGEPESFYKFRDNAIIRVLRSTSIHVGTRPAHIQIFSSNGQLLREATKLRESSSSFFLRNFSHDINSSLCTEFQPTAEMRLQSNIMTFRDVSPRDAFTIRSTCLGLDLR